MKTIITTLAIIASATIAKADGFVCQSDEGLVVKVYNHTDANMGTRTGAVMILSDAYVSDGRKTIATFDAASGLLSSKGSAYSALVDLRFTNSSRKGELIGGTKLGFISELNLYVNHTYGQEMLNYEETEGVLEIVKRNGEVSVIDLICNRYLKN